jgi:hypothetical protein
MQQPAMAVKILRYWLRTCGEACTQNMQAEAAQ